MVKISINGDNSIRSYCVTYSYLETVLIVLVSFLEQFTSCMAADTLKEEVSDGRNVPLKKPLSKSIKIPLTGANLYCILFVDRKSSFKI